MVSRMPAASQAGLAAALVGLETLSLARTGHLLGRASQQQREAPTSPASWRSPKRATSPASRQLRRGHQSPPSHWRAFVRRWRTFSAQPGARQRAGRSAVASWPQSRNNKKKPLKHGLNNH